MEENKTKIKSFTDLKAWQEGHLLVIKIYKTTKNFPKDETFGLTNQMRRAAVSVTSNIAEGFGRQTYKDKAHFYYQSQGSLTELKDQIIIAKDIEYLSDTDFNELMDKANFTHQILQGLITKTKTFINPKS